ncbi:c-type cytochrome [Marinobacterium sediminicola]|uniref:Cytochrome C oxidase, cbb3-type, subunit III n=1 Tax=Marinobacterium sediminicola TaxID=518898 RepID=A0ABY1S180_9GAMM|nr:cytochrome c [Marinobacterium sediminicola]ULG68300.1 cytochrome c [Marinobacterium sediminicola]SMR74855.1 Cytochrome C oxidase, cbb3-type, subunit III [Marinobacterium sediminicola]
MKLYRVGFALVTAFGLSACGNDAPSASASGAKLYNYYCADCHHADGAGSFLEGVPANRTTNLNEAQLVRLILHGHEGSKMPVFSQLQEEQAERIAQYLLQELHR